MTLSASGESGTMSNSREVQRYLETDIQSISAEKLLVLLYEKMADDLLEARRALTAGNRIRMADRITHSQQIIAELLSALDHGVGGEISQNLESLYDYMFLEHLEVLVDQNVQHIDNCFAVMTPLLTAWRQIPAGTADENGRSRTLQSVSA
jgi:flagellar protein FliS